MTPADRESYGRQFEAAQRHLPRGHVINHATWRDGQLLTESGPVQKPPKEPEFVARVGRGLVQGTLL